jgi:hypothetical protein
MRWHRRFANRVEIEEQTDELLLEADPALFLIHGERIYLEENPKSDLRSSILPYSFSRFQDEF